MDGEALIKDVRSNLSESENLDDAVASLNQLYFEAFSDVERDGLYEAAREYLQKGGIFLRATETPVKTNSSDHISSCISIRNSQSMNRFNDLRTSIESLH